MPLKPIVIEIQHHHLQMFLEEDWDIETLTVMISEEVDTGMPMALPTEGETNGPIYSLPHHKPIVILHVRQHEDNLLCLEPIPSHRRVRMSTIDVVPQP